MIKVGGAIVRYILKGKEQKHMEEVLAAFAIAIASFWALLSTGYIDIEIQAVEDVALELKKFFFSILKTRNYQTLRIIKIH